MTIGLIGVGHMAGFLVKGLRAQGSNEAIALGPRNRETAARLAAAYDCQVMESNQAVVDAADVIVLTVPAKRAKSVLEELTFRPGQLAISACAGQGHAFLKEAAAPARLVTSLPVAAATIGRSPTLLYPADAEAERILAPLGPVFVMKDEATFMAASVNSATCGWIVNLI
ncbi:MAG TPA: NAD(P)-binding domain-containing protein, partial [Kiloniellaceae bacterium]|nr:NAD(P)-binding domain-containing protein [Kiloniellaceae bacterium]